MNFLKRIRSLAWGGAESGPKKNRREPAEQTAANGPPESPATRERLERLNKLSPREREVYSHLVRGLKMKEIAPLLGVTYATVNFHCRGLYKKLCIHTRAQLFLQYASLDAGGAPAVKGEAH